MLLDCIKAVVFDFDGTLATWDGEWHGPLYTGEPVPLMVERVKMWLSMGRDVRVFTGRCAAEKDGSLMAELVIGDWCEVHLGKRLPVTCIKDHMCRQIWDDIAVGVESNTGRAV